ncbi:MAG: cobalt chelatase [Proteobacteria bacterium]|nr:cobalt chelatase [Pseudomonadota bacterium]
MHFSEKQKQQVEELCGASIRALTGLCELHHRGKTLFLAGKRVRFGALHLQPDPLESDFRSHRGAADGIALRLKHSDQELHLSLSPKLPLAKLIFDLLEQLRVESLVSDQHPGIKVNLLYQFREWSMRFHQAKHTESQPGILIYTIAQLAWSRLSGNPTLEATDDLIEATRASITPIIGHELTGLKRDRHDQNAFAQHALSIAQIVDNSLRASSEKNADQQNEQAEIYKALSRMSIALDFSDVFDDSNIATIITGDSKVLSDQPLGYRVFTRRYDTEIKASSQVRKDELREFRERLDRLIHAQGINIPRLSRQISNLLAVPGRDGWLFGEEEGLIDGRRLSLVVSSPAERRVFLRDRYRFKNDCLVSFLIDCSGSMKKHIDSIAMLVDIFGRALDQADISSEILGFTTRSWNGGRAFKEWVSQGRPTNPGRLAEQCHLVYKNADTSWRKSRRSIAALLKSSPFREGIDGEAVDWACDRMLRHGEQRKILIVISDGSPMDSATHQANDAYYLDNHLKQVVEKYDKNSSIEIYGLGVGLSLTPYYRHCLAVDLGESLSNSVFRQILQMIEHAKRR